MEELKEVIAKLEEMYADVDRLVVDEVMEYCLRKMKLAGIENPELYLPFLFADELKNYYIRREITAKAIKMMIK